VIARTPHPAMPWRAGTTVAQQHQRGYFLYELKTSRRFFSPKTTTCSRHSRRIDPTSPSAYLSCQGDRDEIGRFQMLVVVGRRMKASHSRCRHHECCNVAAHSSRTLLSIGGQCIPRSEAWSHPAIEAPGANAARPEVHATPEMKSWGQRTCLLMGYEGSSSSLTTGAFWGPYILRPWSGRPRSQVRVGSP
jgi:hypothetical protein